MPTRPFASVLVAGSRTDALCYETVWGAFCDLFVCICTVVGLERLNGLKVRNGKEKGNCDYKIYLLEPDLSMLVSVVGAQLVGG